MQIIFSHAHTCPCSSNRANISRIIPLNLSLIYFPSFGSVLFHHFVCTFAKEEKYICTGGYKTDDLHSRLKAGPGEFSWILLPVLSSIHSRANESIHHEWTCPSLPICANFCLLFDRSSSIFTPIKAQVACTWNSGQSVPIIGRFEFVPLEARISIHASPTILFTFKASTANLSDPIDFTNFTSLKRELILSAFNFLKRYNRVNNVKFVSSKDNSLKYPMTMMQIRKNNEFYVRKIRKRNIRAILKIFLSDSIINVCLIKQYIR